MCSISKFASKNCKRFDIIITRNYLKSNLTNEDFYTKTGENLTCKTSNVVYGIEYAMSGLICVGGNKYFNKRMSGHRFEIDNGVFNF
jgi:hypothetical protein